MNVVYLCLGGNLGNREVNLTTAILKITQFCGNLLAQSSVYETNAWGTSSTLKYLNQVIKIETNLSANNLLSALLLIEATLGRARTQNQYADRTIDIDIIFFNDDVIITPNLQIPHPRLHLRNFVLKPLAEINETIFHPILKKTIKQLALQCPDNNIVNSYLKK